MTREGGAKAAGDLPQHWVLIRLGAMGDVLLAAGVMDYWRRTRGLRFSVLTKAAWAGLLQQHPAVEAIIPLEPEQLALKSFAALSRRLAKQHKGHGLLDLHGTPRSRLLSLFWQGPVKRYPKMALQRRLYALGKSEKLRRRLESCTVPQRYALALEPETAEAPPVEELAPKIFLTQQELEQARRELDSLKHGGRPLVALHPFAAHANKTWPAERWLQLLQGLRNAGLEGYFIGRGELSQSLQQSLGDSAAGSFVNTATPRQSAALLACSRALVTGDSGPMHLGVAAGTHTVALFGPTARAWGFFPPPPHQVLQLDMPCRPCSLHGKGACRRDAACMRDMPAQQVLEAVLRAPGGGAVST